MAEDRQSPGPLMLLVQAPNGAPREWCIEEIRRLADQLRVAVQVPFSGLPLIAFPDQTAEEVEAQFTQTIEQLEQAQLRQRLTGGRGGKIQ